MINRLVAQVRERLNHLICNVWSLVTLAKGFSGVDPREKERGEKLEQSVHTNILKSFALSGRRERGQELKVLDFFFKRK